MKVFAKDSGDWFPMHTDCDLQKTNHLLKIVSGQLQVHWDHLTVKNMKAQQYNTAKEQYGIAWKNQGSKNSKRLQASRSVFICLTIMSWDEVYKQGFINRACQVVSVVNPTHIL